MISGWVDFSRNASSHAESSQDVRTTASGAALSGVRVFIDDPTATQISHGPLVIVAWGAPRFEGGQLCALARDRGAASAWLSLFEQSGVGALSKVKGGHAVAIIDIASKRALLAVDRFSIRSVCYCLEDERLAFSDRADTVPSLQGQTLDMQAIYDYLYFHFIPAPRTVFQGVQRLPAGHSLHVENGTALVQRCWIPSFEENHKVGFDELKAEFRGLLSEAVRTEAEGSVVGCFLSGGTDSSTVVGTLGAVSGKPPKTYSIGFDAEGYDEMAYARIAARHFGTDHHEYYLKPEDLVDGIPKVAAHFDQPFGNSSALPAYYCALEARRGGVEKLLAGDGGDELFGGNTRYAKQRLFGAYEAIPRSIREGAIEPLLLGVPALQSLPPLSKGASYVRQARIPMPDRMNAYNLLKRVGDAVVLTEAFLGQIDVDQPVAEERRTYDECTAKSLVNRMLAYDWKFTLADNDLPKVIHTAGLAGMNVGFPLLADEIVDFSLRLRPEQKVRGLKLRYFFKEALKGFLPVEIINKKKHGFGLPFGAWVSRHQGLRDFAFASLDALGRRGFVRREFLRELVGDRLAQHPAYYGEMIWILMMLEQWLVSRPAARLSPNQEAAIGSAQK